MDLAALTEEEQVARLTELARAALPAWGLAAPDVAVTLIKYRENAVFGVAAGDRRHVLRVHRPGYRTDAAIRSEMAWVRALAARGIPTPAVATTLGGDVLTVAAADGVPEPRQCDLIGWVEGEPLGSLERGVALDEAALRRSYETVGALAARIHAHGVAWARPADFSRPSWDAASLVGDDPAWGRFWELDALEAGQRAVLLRARDRTRARLAALGPADLLVHGDLIPDNILASTAGTRVIDFDDCGWSWCAFELVTSLFPLLVSGGFDAGLAGYLDGYRGVRPFPEAELAHLPSLVMARALSYLGWPVGRPEIHSQRAIVPLIAAAVTELAEGYLRDEG